MNDKKNIIRIYSCDYHFQCSSSLWIDTYFHLVSFPSVQRTSFSISCSMSLLVIVFSSVWVLPSLNFWKKKFYFAFVLKDSFTEYIEFTIDRFFPFNTLKIKLFPCLLAYTVSNKKSAAFLLCIPLYVNAIFPPLATFNIFLSHYFWTSGLRYFLV